MESALSKERVAQFVACWAQIAENREEIRAAGKMLRLTDPENFWSANAVAGRIMETLEKNITDDAELREALLRLAETLRAGNGRVLDETKTLEAVQAT
jgi:hypothetical protein